MPKNRPRLSNPLAANENQLNSSAASRFVASLSVPARITVSGRRSTFCACARIPCRKTRRARRAVQNVQYPLHSVFYLSFVSIVEEVYVPSRFSLNSVYLLLGPAKWHCGPNRLPRDCVCRFGEVEGAQVLPCRFRSFPTTWRNCSATETGEVAGSFLDAIGAEYARNSHSARRRNNEKRLPLSLPAKHAEPSRHAARTTATRHHRVAQHCTCAKCRLGCNRPAQKNPRRGWRTEVPRAGVRAGDFSKPSSRSLRFLLPPAPFDFKFRLVHQTFGACRVEFLRNSAKEVPSTWQFVRPNSHSPAQRFVPNAGKGFVKSSR